MRWVRAFRERAAGRKKRARVLKPRFFARMRAGPTDLAPANCGAGSRQGHATWHRASSMARTISIARVRFAVVAQKNKAHLRRLFPDNFNLLAAKPAKHSSGAPAHFCPPQRHTATDHWTRVWGVGGEARAYGAIAGARRAVAIARAERRQEAAAT